MKLRTSLLMASLFALTACAAGQNTSTRSEASYRVSSSNPFISTNYKAADALIDQLGDKLNPGQPMIVATIVNIDDLNSSSTFGRTISEQISARFSQSTFSMIEMKFRGYVYMKQDQGELLLTREIRDVAKNHNAQGVIVGTYSLSGDSVFVNLKVIQPNTNVVLAGHDYVFPMDSNVKTMTKAIIRR
ncbi:MAG: FlgO family outer membrane protein [Methylotenera sp.]|nr:FlgO family outer membrane protein [Methylotenera sp.]MDD4926311.1 FlgO family outer membrane protein [Methylotenera sp.]